MKKAVILLSALIASAALYADELFLQDNTVIKGEVTGFTSENIRYKSDNGQVSEMARSRVEKIVYSDGRQVDLTDRIFLKDNSILSGKVTGKNGEFIEYNPAGPLPSDRILISSISRIIYSSGAVEHITAVTGFDTIYLKDGRILKGNDISIYERYIEFYNESGVKETYGKDIIEKIEYGSGEVKTFSPGEESSDKKKSEAAGKSDTPPAGAFVEFELGWNGYTGAGVRFDYMFLDNFSINGGIGAGFWGYRVSGALRYYLDYPYGTAFSIGAVYNTGGELESESDTTDSSGNVATEDVTFTLKPVVCINATLLHSWMVNGKDRIYIEGGYSYAIQKKKYTYETESGRKLTEGSEDLMDFLAPGGVILTIGYAISF